MEKYSIMEQYKSLKQEAGSRLLFFQMGEFYELFFEDAKKTSELLGITLTKRGLDENEQPIPMCGIPVHNANNYFLRLIRMNQQIAVCEQIEDPSEARKKRGYKAIVERKIVRIITSATIIEEELLSDIGNNYLASIGVSKKGAKKLLSIAWGDVSTGDCFYSNQESIATTMQAIAPKEILIPESLLANKPTMQALAPFREILIPWQDKNFQKNNIEKDLKKIFAIESLAIIDDLEKHTLMALGVMSEYILSNIKDKSIKLKLPKSMDEKIYMSLGNMVHQHLELLASSSKSSKNSVLQTITRTKTAQGKRLLIQRLAMPICDREIILERQNKVAWFVENTEPLNLAREILTNMPDLERSLARIGHSQAQPRDLTNVLSCLKIGRILKKDIEKYIETKQNLEPYEIERETIIKFLSSLHQNYKLEETLEKALENPPPIKPSEGNFIRDGYAADIDALRNKNSEQQRQIKFLEQTYKKSTKIENLRIKNNQASGYFIEFNPKFARNLPPEFIHKQNLTNAVRYTTEELQNLDLSLLETHQNLIELERKVLLSLFDMLREEFESLENFCVTLSETDWITSMAHLAIENNYTRPELLGEEEQVFDIEGGRHPVVEQLCENTGEFFTTNDCSLNESDRIWLLTGPNMAGKSTFIRQNAIIAILAQTGSFVPAKRAKMSIIKSIFSRVGASDDISQGRSTFMVEMLDVATILSRADKYSLVILDEVGRGTSTFDGLAIAWACLEHLHHKSQSLCLFASHYHELNQLNESLDKLSNHTMKVEEYKGQVVFLHHVVSGSIDRSYGIHVAALAGLPSPVIKRAYEILTDLEKNDSNSLPLFKSMDSSSTNQARNPPNPFQPLVNSILEIDSNDLSPKQALDIFFDLQQQAINISKD